MEKSSTEKGQKGTIDKRHRGLVKCKRKKGSSSLIDVIQTVLVHFVNFACITGIVNQVY